MFTYVKNTFTKVKKFVLKILDIENDFNASKANFISSINSQKCVDKEARLADIQARKTKRTVNKVLRDLEIIAKQGKWFLRLSTSDFKHYYNYYGKLEHIANALKDRGFDTEVVHYDTLDDELYVTF